MLLLIYLGPYFFGIGAYFASKYRAGHFLYKGIYIDPHKGFYRLLSVPLAFLLKFLSFIIESD